MSVALHLLEMATGLVHFYERNENDYSPRAARQAIRPCLQGDVLELAVNTACAMTYLYVEGCRARQANPSAFVRQSSTTLVMPGGVTLHARPLL